MKKCAYCGKLKPLNDFFKTSRKNGYTARCKKCHGLGVRVCGICGKEFVGVSAKLFCSEACRKKSRPQTFCICEQCGITFGPVEHLGRKFCSVKCKALTQKGSPSKKKGKQYPHLRRAREGFCIVCNKKFRAVNDFGDRKQIYCSHRCYLKNRRVSHFEQTVGEYLEQHGILLTTQFKVKKWCFDFKVKGANILIEADGSYWHSFETARLRDKRKNNWCKQHGYELYRIDELEFRDDKQKACDVIIKRWEDFTGQKSQNAQP